MRRFPGRALALNSLPILIVAGALGGLLVARDSLPLWAAALLVLVTLAALALRMRRWLRRMASPVEPVEGVRRALEEHVEHYRRLSEAEQARFRREVQWFLLDQRIIGVKVRVDDTLRALVAASAVLLTFGLDDYEWDTTRDILIYPDAFDERYETGKHKTRLGQVGSQGPIIFSAPALRAGFARSTDGHNVGLHEFAHVLDFDDGQIDGLPANLNWQAIRPWVEQMHALMKRRDRQGRRGQVLRDYGYTNEAEFFACATEMFFEQPKLLRERAPALYTTLREFYRQEPG